MRSLNYVNISFISRMLHCAIINTTNESDVMVIYQEWCS